MATAYDMGQEVLIKTVSEKGLSVREAAMRPYSGHTGMISDYHWIEPPSGQIFYLYTVRIGDTSKEIVLYEDEIEAVY